MGLEKKLELTLCGMLPYGLKVRVNDWGVKKETFDVLVYGINQQEVIIDNPYGNFDYVDLEQCKPLLHSLEKLTEPVLEGGFVPIVELAKIAGFSCGGNYHKCKDVFTVESLDRKNGFFFDIEKKYFSLSIWKKMADFPIMETINQLELFEQLKKWHFNIYDLHSDHYVEKSDFK